MSIATKTRPQLAQDKDEFMSSILNRPIEICKSNAKNYRNSHIDVSLLQFRKLLFKPDDIVEVRVLPKRRSFFWRASELEIRSATLLRRLNANSQNIFFSVNPRSRKGGTRDSDTTMARCLFADFDNLSISDVSERIADLGFDKPAALVRSGHGVHAYWMLPEPIHDLSEWRSLQQALAGIMGSDKKVCNPSRVMRLPGFFNCKEKPWVPCELISINYDNQLSSDAFNRLKLLAQPEQSPALSTQDARKTAERYRQAHQNAEGGRRWALKALQSECERIQLAPRGEGNDQQNKSAFAIGQIVGAGLLSREEAFSAMLEAANLRGGKSKGVKAETALNSGLSAGMQLPRVPSSNVPSGKANNKDISQVEFFDADKFSADWAAFIQQEAEELANARLLQDGELSALDRFGFGLHDSEFWEGEAGKDFAIDEELDQQARLEAEAAEDTIEHGDGDCDSDSEEDGKRHRGRFERRSAKRSAELGVTRPRVDGECTYGGVVVYRSVEPGATTGGSVHLNCNKFDCPICGYDLEGDYLQHDEAVSSRLIDGVENPQIGMQSRDVEDTHIQYASVTGCYEVLLNTDGIRKQYVKKLSKIRMSLLKRDIRGFEYRIHLAPNETFHVFVITPPGFDAKRLNFKPRNITPTQCTFAHFKAMYREYISQYGKTIFATKLTWAHLKQRGYSWISCSTGIRMPERSKPTGKNKKVASPSPAWESAVIEKYGVVPIERDPEKIDKSGCRGLTRRVRKFTRYCFPKSMTFDDVEAFYSELAQEFDFISVRQEQEYQPQAMGDTCPLFHLVT